MISNNETQEINHTVQVENTEVDSTRGQLLTDIQQSVPETPMPSTLESKALSDTTIHDIKTILERPVNLGTYAWTSNAPELPTVLTEEEYILGPDFELHVMDFPAEIFKRSALVVEKLQNYQFLKADFEIELKISAQPFLQGALGMFYNPFGRTLNKFRRDGVQFLASQTSLPHKMLYLEQGNSIKLTCPYANIFDLFDLANNDNQFGTVHIYVVSKLRGPEATATVNYTLFARLINPEFKVPTSKYVLSTFKDEHDMKRLRSRGLLHAQALRGEEDPSNGGFLHSLTAPIKRAAGAAVSVVSDMMPSVAIPDPSWVSRAMQIPMLALGFSKPTLNTMVTDTVLKPNKTMIHTEGGDNGTALALLQDNSITGHTMIPENKDEMALDYIFARPNIFKRFSVDAIEFAGDKLMAKWPNSPFQPDSYDSNGSMFLGSFSYASLFGTLWRGTINYDVTTIKTAYHQGRFAIVYFPETDLEDVPQNLGEALNTNYNVVCNLRDSQDELGRVTYRISVPYLSNVPWRQTYLERNGKPLAGERTTSTGSIGIYSLVNLSYPPTVSDTVQFLVSISGGSDYQIARPTTQVGPGFSVEGTPARKRPMLHAQSLAAGAVDIPVDENLLVPNHSSADVTKETTGEYFVSLRALMKRFGKLGRFQNQNNYLAINTRAFTENDVGARAYSADYGSQSVLLTPFYMISYLYRFYNGATNTKLIPDDPSAMISSFLNFTEDESNDFIELPTYREIGQPVFQQLQQVSNSFEVRTPYYNPYRADVTGSATKVGLGKVMTAFKLSKGEADVYEAAGDDFNFYFLVGPPVMRPLSQYIEDAIIPSVRRRNLNFSTVTKVWTSVKLDGEGGIPDKNVPYYVFANITIPGLEEEGGGADFQRAYEITRWEDAHFLTTTFGNFPSQMRVDVNMNLGIIYIVRKNVTNYMMIPQAMLTNYGFNQIKLENIKITPTQQISMLRADGGIDFDLDPPSDNQFTSSYNGAAWSVDDNAAIIRIQFAAENVELDTNRSGSVRIEPYFKVATTAGDVLNFNTDIVNCQYEFNSRTVAVRLENYLDPEDVDIALTEITNRNFTNFNGHLIN